MHDKYVSLVDGLKNKVISGAYSFAEGKELTLQARQTMSASTVEGMITAIKRLPKHADRKARVDDAFKLVMGIYDGKPNFSTPIISISKGRLRKGQRR